MSINFIFFIIGFGLLFLFCSLVLISWSLVRINSVFDFMEKINVKNTYNSLHNSKTYPVISNNIKQINYFSVLVILCFCIYKIWWNWN